MIKQKRILVVCQHFWPEEFRINEICVSLSKIVDVEVLCGIPSYPIGKFFKGYNYFFPRSENHEGIRIMRVGEIPQWKKGGYLFVSINYIWFLFSSILNLPRIFFRRYHCVFIYGLSPVFMGFSGIVFSLIKRVKSVFYILDYWPDSLYSIITINNTYIRQFIKKISFWHYINSDVILTPSKGMLNKLRFEIKKTEKNSFFLPQSCSELYEKNIYSKELHIRFDGKFNLIYAGNIGPAQSLETIVEAVFILNEKRKELVNLLRIIILGDGISRNEIKNKIIKMNLSDFFVFEGQIKKDKILEYNELADAFYVSLKDDPLFSIMLPAKIQSYMAAGKPILASLNGEGKDTIIDANCGIVCNSGDHEQLASSLNEILSYSPKKRKELGDNGNKYYKKNYLHDIFMNQLIGYLDINN